MVDEKKQGFDNIALHRGYTPNPMVVIGLGQGEPYGISLYHTNPFVFKNTEHAANLFTLKEPGNIYSSLSNPMCNILETQNALLEGGHPLSALVVASGTTTIFYSITNLAQRGDNIISSNALYGGTYTKANEKTTRHDH